MSIKKLVIYGLIRKYDTWNVQVRPQRHSKHACAHLRWIFTNTQLPKTLYSCPEINVYLMSAHPKVTCYYSIYTGCPTRYRTRHFFNNSNTNEHSFISIQSWRLGLAGTRAQSCDQYGSGTLHPGQLGGSLPLLSPAFRHSHFSRQVPPSATTREILAAQGGTVGEKDVR